MRDSLANVYETLREQGLQGILNGFRWEDHPFNDNFDANGVWRGERRHANGPRRASTMTADQVRERVNALPTELYATDEDLQTR